MVSCASGSYKANFASLGENTKNGIKELSENSISLRLGLQVD